MQPIPRVVDLSHYQYDDRNGKFDWASVKSFGIWGVIWKATESTSYVDKTYDDARQQVQGAGGLLWGAYHFFRPGNVDAQVDHFLNIAKPDGNTLLVLDHEDDGCSIDDVKRWLRRCEDETGQRPCLYSGSVIKEQLGDRFDEYLAGCRLWMPQYGSSPDVPECWDSMWLWQYTDGDVGPSPHSVPGIGKCDINSYSLSRQALEQSWSTGMPPSVTAGLNETETLWLQASLNLLDASPALDTDGQIGPKTRDAVGTFQKSVGLEPTGLATKQTIDLMIEKIADWNEERHYVEVTS